LQNSLLITNVTLNTAIEIYQVYYLSVEVFCQNAGQSSPHVRWRGIMWTAGPSNQSEGRQVGLNVVFNPSLAGYLMNHLMAASKQTTQAG